MPGRENFRFFERFYPAVEGHPGRRDPDEVFSRFDPCKSRGLAASLRRRCGEPPRSLKTDGSGTRTEQFGLFPFGFGETELY